MSIARDRLRVSVARLRWGCAAVVQRVGTPGVSGAVAALAGLALLAPVAIVVLAMKVIWIAPALRDAERRIAGCGAELRRHARLPCRKARRHGTGHKDTRPIWAASSTSFAPTGYSRATCSTN